MKTIWLGLIASIAIAAGLPSAATAHPEEESGYSDDWNNGGGSYDEFNQEYQHIWNGIQHGLQDGSYSRWEANGFFRQMQAIRKRANWEQQSGYYNPEEIQSLIEHLHDRMHVAHERGHERQDDYANQYRWNGYGYRYW